MLLRARAKPLPTERRVTGRACRAEGAHGQALPGLGAGSCRRKGDIGTLKAEPGTRIGRGVDEVPAPGPGSPVSASPLAAAQVGASLMAGRGGGGAIWEIGCCWPGGSAEAGA